MPIGIHSRLNWFFEPAIMRSFLRIKSAQDPTEPSLSLCTAHALTWSFLFAHPLHKADIPQSKTPSIVTEFVNVSTISVPIKD
jgi:hypothetical protein